MDPNPDIVFAEVFLYLEGTEADLLRLFQD
jgi:hypothetical protein